MATFGYGMAALLLFGLVIATSEHATAQSHPDPSKAPRETPLPWGRYGTELPPPQSSSITLRTKVAEAEVWLNGKFIGKTEAQGVLIIANLPAGPHRLRVSKRGYQEWEREISVSASANIDVAVTMQAAVMDLIDPLKHGRPGDPLPRPPVLSPPPATTGVTVQSIPAPPVVVPVPVR